MRFAAAVLPAAAIAAVAGCASSSGARAGAAATADAGPIRNPAAGSVNVTRIEATARTIEIATTGDVPPVDEQVVAAGADRAFGALVEVYEGHGLTVNVVQSDARTLGVRDARVTRRLGKTLLSRYFSCGADAMAGPIADSYLVTLTALTRVAPSDAAHSTLLTQVSATARALNTSGTPIRCGTTGRLERELNTEAALVAMR